MFWRPKNGSMGKTVNVRKKDDTKRAFSYLIKFFVPNVRYEPRISYAALCTNGGDAAPATTFEAENLCSQATPRHRS